MIDNFSSFLKIPSLKAIKSMYVCVCQAITEKQLHKFASKAEGDFHKLQLKHGVAATCGRCEGCAKQICALHDPSKKTACA